MIKYRVVAKVAGIIYDGESLTEADLAFEVFKFKCQPRESDEMVTIFRDSDIVKQWYCHFELK